MLFASLISSCHAFIQTMPDLNERQREIEARYSLIEDRHERLNAIISHKLRARELAEEERQEAWLVRGCASRVWLKVRVVDGRLHARYAADSVMVRGLVALLVELYHGADPAEAAHFSPRFLETLGLAKILSATRLHGLAQIIRRFQEASHVD